MNSVWFLRSGYVGIHANAVLSQLQRKLNELNLCAMSRTAYMNLGPDQTNSFSLKTHNKNAYFLKRLRLSSTLTRPKPLMKTDTFENGFKSGVFFKQIVLKTLVSSEDR